MTQESEIAAVKRKIRGLTEKTTQNGASEAESIAAMKKVGELLLQYNLSMDEVTLREQKCVTGRFETGSKHLGVMADVFFGIQQLCGIKTWYTRNPNGIVWNFFGLESDVELAIYLSSVITVSSEVSYQEFKYSKEYRLFNGHKKIASNNFKKGFGIKINNRLLDLANERKKEEEKASRFHQEQMKDRMVEASDFAMARAAEQTVGTTLICVAKHKMIEDEFKKHGPKLRSGTRYTNGRVDATTRSMGQQSATKVNLGRPVSGSTSVKGLLK